MDCQASYRAGFSEASADNVKNVNWQAIIRSLVIDGGMKLDEVLELNPRQIMALCMEKTQAPGLLKPDMLRNGITNMRRTLSEW